MEARGKAASAADRLPRGRGLAWAFAVGVGALFFLELSGAVAGLPAPGVVGTPIHDLGAPQPGASVAKPTLALGVSASPGAICVSNETTCASGNAQTRVQMVVSANVPIETWPAVDVAFVIETDAFDGVYDPTVYKLPPGGSDPCIAKNPAGPPCEESNGVPFFEDYVGAVANEITTSNPNTAVSFAMLDYQGTCDIWDDPCYAHSLLHVDVPTFLPAGEFTTTATQSFRDSLLGGGYTLPYEDLSSPFLHISSITALYGALNGGLFNWTPNTHHVIVWMGSAAPRDPNYPENICVSSMSELAYDYQNYYGCIAPTCEPSHTFPTGNSPNCVGWVKSSDGNPMDSIAGLAHSATQCTQSAGGSCTIDVIDLFDTPTDALSLGWPAGPGQGPGTPAVEQDTTNILLAGCALAAATGGSWDGPVFASCPDGAQGSLQYVDHGPLTKPNTWNPTLMSAFRGISFGPLYNPVVAVGLHQPLFTFVPFGAIAVAWDPQFATACQTPVGFSKDCPVLPTVTKTNGVISYGWNWSSNASLNEIRVGDVWTASFNVVSTGPPIKTVPIDSCTTSQCAAAGSSPVQGRSTLAVYSVPNETGTVSQSFPYAAVEVTIAVSAISANPPPPAPPAITPTIPVPVEGPVANPVLAIIGLGTPLTAISAQPLAAGMLAAVGTRVMMKYKPIALAQAVVTAQKGSKFEAAVAKDAPIGRME